MNVLLITYQRYSHLSEILKILKLTKANIFIYQNKPVGEYDSQNHSRVREIIANEQSKYAIQFFEPDTHLQSAHSIKYAITRFFAKVENGIIIEDDCIPKDNLHILVNHISEHYSNDAVLSLYDPNPVTQGNRHAAIVRTPFLHVWGWYCNRSIWDEFIRSKNTVNIRFILFHLKKSGVTIKNRAYWFLLLKLIQKQKIKSWDYDFWMFLIMSRRKMYCMIGNQMENRGSDEFATFASKTDHRQDKVSYGELTQLHEIKTYNPNTICELHYRVTYWRLIVLSLIWLRTLCLN